MQLLAHLTDVEFPMLACAYGLGVVTGAFACFVVFRTRPR